MNKFLDEILEQHDALKNTLAFYESEAGEHLLQKGLNGQNSGSILLNRASLLVLKQIKGYE